MLCSILTSALEVRLREVRRKQGRLSPTREEKHRPGRR